MEIEVEAFRADTKASKGLTSAHIAEAASLYDADKAPAPLVFGHPKDNSPALGLIKKARADGNKLFVTLANIADEVVQGVKEKRILGRSVAFWDPRHPSNPNPGKYSLRHLGLLGGQAPAIPGLPALKFSADDDEELNEPAEAVVFAVEEAPTPVQTITEPAPQPEPKPEPTMTEQEIKDLQARADKAEREAADLRKAEEDRQKEFAASEATRRETEDKAALDKLVGEGKLLPAERDDLAKLFSTLPTQALTFSAGESEPRIALASFLDKLPKRTPVGEGRTSPEGKDFSVTDAQKAADDALKARNQRLAEAHKTPATA
jgi:hypothetical protein